VLAPAVLGVLLVVIAFAVEAATGFGAEPRWPTIVGLVGSILCVLSSALAWIYIINNKKS
jgi:hypothetical protein